MFLELRRRKCKFSFWHSNDNYEVDFVLEQPEGSLLAVQVSENLNSLETLKRECRALTAAKDELKPSRLVIITLERLESRFLERIDRSIEIVYFPDFALSDETLPVK